MNTNYCIGLWMGLLLIPGLVVAQSSYSVGTIPAINFNQGIGQNWGLNLKWESRQRWQQGNFNETPVRNLVFVLNDFSLIGARKVGLHSKIAGGYLIRFRNGTQLHRSIQQWTFVRQSGTIRYAHRIATDQTFATGQAPNWRVRYRLNMELPLDGTRLDYGEMYLKIGPELLHLLSGGTYDLELRLVPQIGLIFPNNNKLELGLDYRMQSILKDDLEHNFWLRASWYGKLSFCQ